MAKLSIIKKPRTYGWKPEFARMQISHNPYETWLISQAQSYLGKQDITIEEAKALFTKIDIATRQPIPAAEPPRPSGVLAALRAMVCGKMSASAWLLGDKQ